MLRNEKIGQYEVLQTYGDQIAIVKDTTFEAADTFIMTISDRLELLEIKNFELPGFPQLINQFQWGEKACFIHREFDGCHLDTIPYDVDYSVEVIRNLCLSIHRIWKISNKCFYPTIDLEELYLTKDGDFIFRNAYNFAYYQKCSEESITKQLAKVLYQMVTGRNQLIDIRLFDPSFSYILNSTILQCAKGETSLELEAFATTLLQYNETDQMIYQQDKSLRPPRRRKNSFVRYMPDFDHLEFQKIAITYKEKNVSEENTKENELENITKQVNDEVYEIEHIDSEIELPEQSKENDIEKERTEFRKEIQKDQTESDVQDQKDQPIYEEIVQDQNKEQKADEKQEEKKIVGEKQDQNPKSSDHLKGMHEKEVDEPTEETVQRKEGSGRRSSIPKPQKIQRSKPEIPKQNLFKEKNTEKKKQNEGNKVKQENNIQRESSWNHSLSRSKQIQAKHDKINDQNKNREKKVSEKQLHSQQKKKEMASEQHKIQETKPIQEKVSQKQSVVEKKDVGKDKIDKVGIVQKEKNKKSNSDKDSVEIKEEIKPVQSIRRFKSFSAKNETSTEEKQDILSVKPVTIQEDINVPETIIETITENKETDPSKITLENKASNMIEVEDTTQTESEQTMEDFLNEYEMETGKKLRQPVKIYIPKQIKMAIVGCLVLVIGITGIFVHKTRQRNKYNDMIEVVERSTNHDEKIKTLKEAIKMLPKESKAYEKLLDVYLDDAVFSSKEESAFLKVIHQNWDKVKKGDGYGNLAYEIGKAYWYYYEYDDTNNEEITRMKSAVQWFQDSMKYKSTEKYHRIAKIYCEIGKFNQEITLNVKEGTDKGVYKKYYNNLKNLLEIGNSNTVASLELYKLTVNSIDTYHERFIDDGIDEEEINQTKQDVLYKVNETSVVTEKEKELKNNILYGNK